MRATTVGVVLLLVAVAGAVASDELWVASVGDSLTEGCCDEPLFGGYPKRLASSGNCTYLHGPNPPGGPTQCLAGDPFPACAVVRPGPCVVANRGKSTETAVAALTRLQTEVLPEWAWDVVVFMEGTNDVFNQVSTSSIKASIEAMEEVTIDNGVDFVIGTIIEFHPEALVAPPANRPWLNIDAAALNDQIALIASSRNRYISDQWQRICPSSGTDYHGHDRFQCQFFDYGEKTIVGHPSGLGGQYDGYDNMAAGFQATLNQAAVPGAVTPTAPSGDLCGEPSSFDWTKEAGETANWYRVEVDGGTYGAWHQETDWRPAEVDLCQPDSEPDNDCSLPKPGALSLGEGTHSWRVRSRNPAGLGPWSTTMIYSFFSALPPAATPKDPSGSIFDPTPTYRWMDLAAASEYDLEVFNGTVWIPSGTYTQTACDGTVCSAAPPGPILTPGPRKFRLLSRNTCGSGPPGPEQSFTLLDCASFPDRNLENTTVTGAVTERACDTITAGNLGAGDYVVDGAAADVLFHAGNRIVIDNGFSVGEGSFTGAVDF